MKKKITNIAFIFLCGAFVGITPLVISSHIKPDQDPYRYESVKSELPYAVVSPIVPSTVQFGGQQVDLTRYDRRERMDRELNAFTYMHSSTTLLVKRANRFFPIIEPILRANGIPDDFKYLMVIESSLNTLARSSAGAVGLWQFMQSTGRENGLEVNNNIDERYHVVKSTIAACRYLREAYDLYGDWVTVAASYNAGKGRISGELRKQLVDNAMDLWLVEETSRYMFRIFAAKLVLENPQQYGFMLRKEQLYPPMIYKEVSINTSIEDLAEFAKNNGVTYAQLKDANPWLRSTSLENKGGRDYILLIPQQDGMYYDPEETVPHNRNWVIN